MANKYGYLQDETGDVYIPAIPSGGRLYFSEVTMFYIDSNNNLLMGGKGGHTYLRPNGAFNDAGQVIIQSDGQINMAGMTLDRRYVRAETISDTSDSSLFNKTGTSQKLNRAGLYSIQDSTNGWWNLINIRHRNGDSDGVNYGMQIRKTFNVTSGALQMRTQAAGNWSDWENLYRAKVIYSNSSGTYGTFTLSESAANFTILEIYFVVNGSHDVVRVYSPDGKTVSLLTDGERGATNYNFYCVGTIKISGTQVTWAKNQFIQASTTEAAGKVQQNNDWYAIKVDTVVGYR